MKVVLLFFLCATSLHAQTSGKADTSGPCSPAVTGNNNEFRITCSGLSKEQGQKILVILNRILANELDLKEVTAKLNEISRTVAGRPWLQIKGQRLASPLTIDDKGLRVDFTTPLENTSELPAIAAVKSKLFFVTYDSKPEQAVMEEQDKLCDDLQQGIVNGDIPTRTFFHGPDTFPQSSWLIADAKEVNEASRKMSAYFTSPILEVAVLSCVVYKSTSGKEFYRTAYADMVEWPYCQNGSCSGGTLPFHLIPRCFGLFQNLFCRFVRNRVPAQVRRRVKNAACFSRPGKMNDVREQASS